MVTCCVLGIRSTSWFCASGSSCMYWILINSSISWESSLSCICFLSSSSCWFFPCSSACLKVVSYALTFHLSSSSCFNPTSSNLFYSCSSLCFHYSSCTLCFLFFSIAMETLSMIGSVIILWLHSPLRWCTSFLFPLSHTRLCSSEAATSQVISCCRTTYEAPKKLIGFWDLEAF